MRVDVTVLDHRGNPVPALKPEDFLIEEDGVPQKVTSLKFIEATGQPGDDLSLPIRSPEHAAAEAARDDVRVFLIFWDESSIDQFASAIRARDAITRLVTSAFQPTDLVALMDQLTPSDAIRFTRDFNDLSIDVKKLRGRLGVFVPTRSAVEDAQLSKGGDIRRLRSEVTLSALKSAVVFLGTLREGRKSVIFVSEGIRGLGSDATTIMADVVRAANESNTAIYSVDPRGLSARGASDSLYMLADNTGGRTIVNTNGLDTAMRQVVREASAFYLLGYSSLRNPADGQFHQIKVRVNRSGLDVRARRGYWAPSAKAVAEAKTAAAAATPPDAVALALAALTPSTAPRARLLDRHHAGRRRGHVGQRGVGHAGQPRLRRREPGQRAGLGHQRVRGVPVRGARGRPRADVRRPGRLKVELTIRDTDNQVIDTETRTVVVPPPGGTALAWSSPVLLRGRTPLEIRTMTSDLDAPPFAGNEFTRADRLLVRVSLFGDSAGAAVTGRLVSRTGRQLVALPVAPLAAAREPTRSICRCRRWRPATTSSP